MYAGQTKKVVANTNHEQTYLHVSLSTSCCSKWQSNKTTSAAAFHKNGAKINGNFSLVDLFPLCALLFSYRKRKTQLNDLFNKLIIYDSLVSRAMSSYLPRFASSNRQKLLWIHGAQQGAQ
jgi:hypothetical protein